MSDERRENTGQGSGTLSPGRLAEIACLLEVTARKPGNVHRGADFPDLHFVDFLLSAAAIAGPLDRAADEGVGTAVLAAVESTRRVVSTNTNLGMILLLAPLAAVPSGTDLARASSGSWPARRSTTPGRSTGRSAWRHREAWAGRPSRTWPTNRR